MDKSHPLNTPLVIWSLEVDKDPFRPKEDTKDILGPEVPYLSAIRALLISQIASGLILHCNKLASKV